MRSIIILALFLVAALAPSFSSADETANRATLTSFFAKLADPAVRNTVPQTFDAAFVYRPYGGQPLLQTLFQLQAPKNEYTATEYVGMLNALPVVADSNLVSFESPEEITGANNTFVYTLTISFIAASTKVPIIGKNHLIFEMTDDAKIKSINEFFGAFLITGARCGSLPIIVSTKPAGDQQPDFLKAYAVDVLTPLNATVDKTSVATFVLETLSNITANSTWAEFGDLSIAGSFELTVQQRLSGEKDVKSITEVAFDDIKKWLTTQTVTNLNARVSSKNADGDIVVLVTFTWSNFAANRFFSTPIALLVTVSFDKVQQIVLLADGFQQEIAASGVQTPAVYSCLVPPTDQVNPPQASAATPVSVAAPQGDVAAPPAAEASPVADAAPQAAGPKAASTNAPSSASRITIPIALFSVMLLVLAL